MSKRNDSICSWYIFSGKYYCSEKYICKLLILFFSFSYMYYCSNRTDSNFQLMLSLKFELILYILNQTPPYGLFTYRIIDWIRSLKCLCVLLMCIVNWIRYIVKSNITKCSWISIHIRYSHHTRTFVEISHQWILSFKKYWFGAVFFYQISINIKVKEILRLISHFW